MPDGEGKDFHRRELLSRRDGIPQPVRAVKDRLICEKVLSLDDFKQAGVVFSFASFRSEVNTFPIIEHALQSGKRVLLPRVNREDRSLLLYEVRDLGSLSPGYMGIPEPRGTPADGAAGIADADIVLIPGAGFDLSGNRIGYGGGYYDRLLSGLDRKITVIAPAYEEQIVAEIPTEPHDRKVDMIVTDRRIIRCA